jgi:hypothetical protein
VANCDREVFYFFVYFLVYTWCYVAGGYHVVLTIVHFVIKFQNRFFAIVSSFATVTSVYLLHCVKQTADSRQTIMSFALLLCYF